MLLADGQEMKLEADFGRWLSDRVVKEDRCEVEANEAFFTGFRVGIFDRVLGAVVFVV